MKPGYAGASWFMNNYEVEAGAATFLERKGAAAGEQAEPVGKVCTFCEEPVTEPWCPCLNDVPPDDEEPVDQGVWGDDV